jgi:transposase
MVTPGRSRLGECSISPPSRQQHCRFNAKEYSMPRRSSSRSLKTTHPDLPVHLQHLHLNAAGIDVGASSHFVAVPPDRDTTDVREFGTFTADLYRLADWLKECGVETVVMESTGVYWIPLFEILEERGFDVRLVDARHVKNVSGRKSDVLDCQWLRDLHTYGLLQAAFRPQEQIVTLRSYMRQRAMLLRYAAAHIQHMQ